MSEPFSLDFCVCSCTLFTFKNGIKNLFHAIYFPLSQLPNHSFKKKFKTEREEFTDQPNAMVTSRPGLLRRTMSGSMALLQSGSMLLFITPVTAESCANTQGLGHHLKPGGGLKGMLQLGPYRSELPVPPQCAMVRSRLGLQLRMVSGSMVLLQPGSVLMFVAPDTIEGHVDARGLGYHLGPYWYLRVTLPC